MASLSMFDDHVITHASIILEKQSDWKLWYSMKKQYATVKGVWEYCDPSTTTAPPTIDDEPSDEASEGKWRKWEIKTNAQRATLKAIGEVNLEIMRTVARSKLHLITELDLDVRLRLKTLQDHFKITSQQQVLELSTLYTNVQLKPKNQSTDTWLNEYSRITSLCKAEDMAEMKGTRPQWTFIKAVQAHGDADWSGQHFAVMIGCEEDVKDPPTLEGLINLLLTFALSPTSDIRINQGIGDSGIVIHRSHHRIELQFGDGRTYLDFDTELTGRSNRKTHCGSVEAFSKATSLRLWSICFDVSSVLAEHGGA